MMALTMSFWLFLRAEMAGFGTGGLLHHQLDVLLFDALCRHFFLVLFLFRDRLGHLVRLFFLDFFGHVLRRHFSGSLVWIFDASLSEHNPRVAAFEHFWVWHDEEERLVLAQDDSVNPLDLGESEFLHRLFRLSLGARLFGPGLRTALCRLCRRRRRWCRHWWSRRLHFGRWRRFFDNVLDNNVFDNGILGNGLIWDTFRSGTGSSHLGVGWRARRCQHEGLLRRWRGHCLRLLHFQLGHRLGHWLIDRDGFFGHFLETLDGIFGLFRVGAVHKVKRINFNVTHFRSTGRA